MITVTFTLADDPDAPRCPARIGPGGLLGCDRQEGHTRPTEGGLLGQLNDGDFHLSRDLAGRVWVWPVAPDPNTQITILPEVAG